MLHLPPAHHETSKHDSLNETKVKEKQNKIIPDSNSNLTKSLTHHNQTNELSTWLLTSLTKYHNMLQLKHDIQSPNYDASLPLPLSVGGLPPPLSLVFRPSFTTSLPLSLSLPLALHMKEANRFINKKNKIHVSFT
jgi:hypothetical protein